MVRLSHINRYFSSLSSQKFITKQVTGTIQNLDGACHLFSMEIVSIYIEEDLQLTINQKKSKVCGATAATISGVQHTKSLGKVGCRPSKSAKQRFKEKLRKETRRKRPGTFEEITIKINQITTGWINYYGVSYMKIHQREIQQWLNHRLRQIIWQRWKRVRTRYKNASEIRNRP